jgi:hypothetical protein
MAKARLIFRDRQILADGAIVEMRIWQVPEPVPPSSHRLKYSLFYGYPGRRVVGYDNERGKGDHKHLGQAETRYRFTSVEALIAGFLADVAAARRRA